MNEVEIGARLLLAVVLGGMLGAERELDGQDAGFRTHVLLALGACLFGAVSVAGFDQFLDADGGGNVQVDPTRVASYVAAGIGFLGGGAIIKHGGAVHGITTASSIWTTAAIGLSAGVGFYVGAVVAAVLALVTLRALKPLSRRIQAHARVSALIVMVQGEHAASAILTAIERVDQQSVGRIDIGEPTAAGTREVHITLRGGASPDTAQTLLSDLENELGADLLAASLES